MGESWLEIQIGKLKGNDVFSRHFGHSSLDDSNEIPRHEGNFQEISVSWRANCKYENVMRTYINI